MKLDREARQRRILTDLEERPTLRVSELAERLAVSGETIRRDLDTLTEQGLIDRTYGGAVRRRALEPSVDTRHGIKIAERERIAQLAMPQLHGATHLMLGSGATTVHVAKRVAAEMKNVTVIAHSFGIATALSLNPTIRVVLAPGIYHASEGAVYGAAAVEFLSAFQPDWAILGASGIDPDGGSDALIDSGAVYSKMAAQARRTMVVADSSKYGLAFPSRWARWSAIDLLVSERPPPPAVAAAAKQHGTEILTDR